MRGLHVLEVVCSVPRVTNLRTRTSVRTRNEQVAIREPYVPGWNGEVPDAVRLQFTVLSK